MVELKEITNDIFEKIINLKVYEHQEAFVSSVTHSLAQAWLYKETAFPFAIYADNIPIGFIMMGYYASRDQYTLWKFLIDKEYQNKGYGRKALLLGIDYLIKTFDVREIYTGVLAGNEAAKHLYSSFGFKMTGKVENNMEEMRYVCRD
mgnify:CR=1 FL=1